MEQIYDTLVKMAIDARKMSYSPYSGYRVGAALLGKSGKIYTGCNVENAAYTPTNCAERTAVFKAVSEGEREFSAIAVAGGLGDTVADFCAPCGVCRQVLSEFCSPEMPVLIVTGTYGYKKVALGELLPYSFGAEDIEKKG